MLPGRTMRELAGYILSGVDPFGQSLHTGHIGVRTTPDNYSQPPGIVNNARMPFGAAEA